MKTILYGAFGRHNFGELSVLLHFNEIMNWQLLDWWINGQWPNLTMFSPPKFCATVFLGIGSEQ